MLLESALITVLVLSSFQPVTAGASRAAAPASPAVFDFDRVDANQIAMGVNNFGPFAADPLLGGPGLEYPRGSGTYLVFTAGLWLGAKVNGAVRLAISDYASEYGPGAMLGAGPDDPSRARYRVYKLLRTYPTTSARDSALQDYQTGAMIPDGAPQVGPLGTNSLSIPGDQMLWSVFNDADPARHTSMAGSTLPLGVEVQQTTWASDRLGALGSTVFIAYRIIHKGTDVLENMYLALWSDPDVGGYADDLVGWDAARGIGYAYNGANIDVQYGIKVPALGMDLLRGPRGAGGARLEATAFARYINGGDPLNSLETWRLLNGYQVNGGPWVDPVTGLPTKFCFPGDPVTDTGWLDADPGDRRMMISSGPFTMQPGDTQDVVVAVIAARGTDRLNSISLLRSYDEAAQAYIDAGGDTVTTAVPRTPSTGHGIALETPRPNPGRGVLTVSFTLAGELPATLELLDLAGRRVFTRDLGAGGAGRHVVEFARPGALAPGLYFLKLSQGGRSVARRVTLLR